MQVRFKITICNANGLCKSEAEVEHYIKTNNIDVLIKSNHPSGNARGGAAVLMKSDISHTHLEPIQHSWVQAAMIMLPSPHGNITTFAFYFPPRHNLSQVIPI